MRQWLAAVVLLVPVGCARTVVDVGSSGSNFGGNAANCPLTAPTHLSSCDVDEQQSCIYGPDQSSTGEGALYTCFEKNSSSKIWINTGGNSATCPLSAPAESSDCAGHANDDCKYAPNFRCKCGPDGVASPKWTCERSRPDWSSAPSGPASVSGSKMIKDLSDTEATTWCHWFLEQSFGPGDHPYREGPLVNGLATGLGGTSNPNFPAEACMATTLPMSYCAANLKVVPCEATVAEISDCVTTIVKETPSPHGCGRFFERAHCEDSIVHRYATGMDAGGPGCSALRVSY